MKVCKKCWILLSNDAEYCTNCGSEELEIYIESQNTQNVETTLSNS